MLFVSSEAVPGVTRSFVWRFNTDRQQFEQGHMNFLLILFLFLLPLLLLLAPPHNSSSSSLILTHNNNATTHDTTRYTTHIATHNTPHTTPNTQHATPYWTTALPHFALHDTDRHEMPPQCRATPLTECCYRDRAHSCTYSLKGWESSQAN